MNFDELLHKIDVEVPKAHRFDDPDMEGCSTLPLASFKDARGWTYTPMLWRSDDAYFLGYFTQTNGEEYAVKFAQCPIEAAAAETGMIDALASRLTRAAAPYERRSLYRSAIDGPASRG